MLEQLLTINVGNILTIISFLVGGIVFATRIRGDVSSIQDRLESLEAEIKRITDILVQVARQDERMNFFEKRLEEYKNR